MNRPIIKVSIEDFNDMYRELAAAAAKSPPIANARKVEEVLLRFGKCVRDARMQRDVIQFSTIAQCNAARAAVRGKSDDLLPSDLAAEELIAFVMDDVLFWMTFGVVVDGRRTHFINLMNGHDVAGLGKEVA